MSFECRSCYKKEVGYEPLFPASYGPCETCGTVANCYEPPKHDRPKQWVREDEEDQ